MAASRNRPEGGLRAPFGLGVLILLLLTSEVGYQDLAALLARQQPVIERMQKAAFASPFGTIHEMRFNFPQPVGASIPPTLDITLVAHDQSDITGSIRAIGKDVAGAGPVVDRSGKGDYGITRSGDRVIALKGDRLQSVQPNQIAQEVAPETKPAPKQQVAARRERAAPRPVPAPLPPLSLAPPAASVESNDEPAPKGFALASAGESRPVSPRQLGGARAAYPVLATPRDDDASRDAESSAEAETGVQPVTSLGFASADADQTLRAARIYFSIDPMGQKLGSLEPWAPGQEPKFEDAEDVAVGPDAPPAAKGDANIKLAALPPEAFPSGERERFVDAPVERADLPPLRDPGVVRKNGMTGGQTIAPKGEVTGVDKQPMT